MLSVVIEAFKKSVIFQIFVCYTATGLYITLHSLSVRLDGIYPVQIHLIGIRDSSDRQTQRKQISRHAPSSTFQTFDFSTPLQEVTWSVNFFIFTI